MTFWAWLGNVYLATAQKGIRPLIELLSGKVHVRARSSCQISKIKCALIRLTEMKINHAMASIEKVFFYYFSRYGPSDSKSEECQFDTLGQFKMTTEIQDSRQKRGNLLVLFIFFFFLKYALKR